MALALDTIRATADRVASSHGLEVVDVEFAGGGGKHRALRVFVEKNAEGRAALTQHAAENPDALPKGVPLELLSGVTHEDCEHFARDFGTVLDVEDLVPGSEYTLEVSSPASSAGSADPPTTPGSTEASSNSRPLRRSKTTATSLAASRPSTVSG